LELVETNELEKSLTFLASWKYREIEIGSGNGHFLAEYGVRNNTCCLLGIELKQKRCLKIRDKINKKQLANIRVFQGMAELLLERLPPSSIDAFHLYYPDPWPKTKQRKRRLLKLSSLERFYIALKENGRIYFTSDIFDYYIQVKLLAILHGGFQFGDCGLPGEAIHSLYAARTLSMGKAAYSLVLVKNATGNLTMRVEAAT